MRCCLRQIDSSNAWALSAALAVHKELNPGGRLLVNSVNGEEASLGSVLPLVSEYGAAVIGLCMDDSGIPATAEGRLVVSDAIISCCDQLGTARLGVIIDLLPMTVGAESKAGLTTLQAIRLVEEKLGVNMTLGASDISHRVPDREVMHGTFLAIVTAAGANCPLVDAAKVRPSILAADLAPGRDEYAICYIRAFRKRINWIPDCGAR